jgi:hypothetical protein
MGTHVLNRAAEIVEGYDTAVTLRQAFYRLVADETLPNTQSAYKGLARVTAIARREGQFPDLIDLVRDIERPVTFDGLADAKDWLREVDRRDRTEGQDWSVYLGIEKAGLIAQMSSWFSDQGIPIVTPRGYSAQTYVEVVAADVQRDGRPAVLLYAGDFYPSGEDIERDFVKRTGCFDEAIRVALTWEQVETHDLPPQMGKATDSRAAAFRERYGRLVQVELDALPPDVLRDLFSEAIQRFWDSSAFEAVMEREARERAEL